MTGAVWALKNRETGAFLSLILSDSIFWVLKLETLSQTFQQLICIEAVTSCVSLLNNFHRKAGAFFKAAGTFSKTAGTFSKAD